MVAYRKRLAVNGKAPYLGPFPGLVECSDVATLSGTSVFVSLTSKCRHLEKLSDHHQIERMHCPYREDLIDILARFPNLKHLQLRLPRSPEIAPLAQLTQIESLVLKCSKHQKSLDFLQGMANLRFLCVSEAMGIDRLTPLGSLSSLQELYIDGTISGRNTVQTLAPLGKLHSLEYLLLLIRVAKQRRTLKPLYKLTKLAFLHLSDDYVATEYNAILRKLPLLDEICFNGGKRHTLNN
ncbi:hypothetical protein [Roseiconus lacunae]|uniref:hypothetical protein n=1 Tax=Roseiconus lacunae TaxID=2605694 RepID=UPI0011F0ACED|nr:hypothetical protein [Roseiconus lacunae]